MESPRLCVSPSPAVVVFAALALAACSPASGPAPGAPSSIAGADAQRALAVAAHCIEGDPWHGAHLGFVLDVRAATAHRAALPGTGVLVQIPDGMYTGRLPPPRPAAALWLDVDLDAQACREVPAP